MWHKTLAEERTIISIFFVMIGVCSFVMMIVVLTFDSIGQSWMYVVDDDDKLCRKFGWVPKPYWAELLLAAFTQVILALFGCGGQNGYKAASVLTLLWVIYQVVSGWVQYGYIFAQFPMNWSEALAPAYEERYDWATNSDRPANLYEGWQDYNLLVYMLATSTSMMTGVQLFIQYVANSLSWSIQNDRDEPSCLVGCGNVSVRAIRSDYLCLVCGFLLVVPLVPAIFTHLLPAAVAYCWLFFPGAAVCYGLCYGGCCATKASDAEAQQEEEQSGGAEDCYNISASLFTPILTIVAIFILLAPIEVGTYLYSFSLINNPITGSDYISALEHWFSNRGTQRWFRCLKATNPNTYGQAVDFMNWV